MNADVKQGLGIKALDSRMPCYDDSLLLMILRGAGPFVCRMRSLRMLAQNASGVLESHGLGRKLEVDKARDTGLGSWEHASGTGKAGQFFLPRLAGDTDGKPQDQQPGR